MIKEINVFYYVNEVAFEKSLRWEIGLPEVPSLLPLPDMRGSGGCIGHLLPWISTMLTL